MSLESRPFTVGLIQMRCSTDSDDNLDRACALLRQAANGGCRVACLPELFRTQYFCQSEDATRFDLAEPIPGPTTQALSSVAQETRMVIVGSIFERRAAGLYHNTAVVIDSDGTLRGRYRKMHIPDDPLYYEKYYFTPGDLGFQAFETSCARVGTLVCWDQWYPEAARLTALEGGRVSCSIPRQSAGTPLRKQSSAPPRPAPGKPCSVRTPSPTESTWLPSTESATKGPRPAAWNSGAVRSWPTPSVESSPAPAKQSEEVLIGVCDPRLQEETRRNWPFLRDRRIDAYGPITERFHD